MKKIPSSAPPKSEIEEATTAAVSGSWFVGVLSLVAAAAAYLYFRVPPSFDFQSRDFNPFGLVPVVLAGFGVSYLARALWTTLRARKYGDSVLELEGEHGVPGETLRGRVRTATDLAPTGDYELRLRCIESVTFMRTRDGEQRTEDRIRWEESCVVPAGSVRSSAGIPFAFALPADAFVDGDPRVKGSLRWVLAVRAPLPGIDFYALFGLEVRPRRPEPQSARSRRS